MPHVEPLKREDIRDPELLELIRRDLLGPWDGETEQFAPNAMGPRERYLVGMLGPRPRPRSERAQSDPVQDVELSAAQGDAAEGELPEVLTPQSLGKLWASSMGLSFAVPADVDWKVRYDSRRMWDGSQNFGASLKALEKLGRVRGYSLVGCDFVGVNAFFVRDDLVAGRFAEPYTAENHYEPCRYATLHRRGHRNGILDRAH